MVYKQTEVYTCGPSAYIEAFSRIKSCKKELQIHEIGRINPSRIFLGISFLEVDSSLWLYTESTNLTGGIIKLVFNSKIKNFVEQINSFNNNLTKKHKSHIKRINGFSDIIRILDLSVELRKKAILLTHSSHWLESGTVHWIVLKGKVAEGYLFADPYLGKVKLFSSNEILTQMSLVKNEDFPLQIVTDFEAF